MSSSTAIRPAAPPKVVTINLRDAQGKVTTFVRPGLWDNAYDAQGNLLRSDVYDNDFVSGDSRRFFIEVNDPAAKGNGVCFVNWRTSDDHRSGQNQNETLTLIEQPVKSGRFVSQWLMIVTDEADQHELTTSGLPGDNAIYGFGDMDHRIRRAGMFGYVEAEYTPIIGTTRTTKVDVFIRNPDERKHLGLQVFILRQAQGGAPFVATHDWAADMQCITETYERLGIWVFTVVNSPLSAGAKQVNGISSTGISYDAVEIDPPAGVIQPSSLTYADQENIAKNCPALPNTIRLFFVGGFADPTHGGESWPDIDFSGLQRMGCSFVVHNSRPYSAAHEIGHILTDKSNNPSKNSDGHFVPPLSPDSPGNRYHNPKNLMLGYGPPPGKGENNRLWDVDDGDTKNKVNQYDQIRNKSHYIAENHK